MLLYFGSFDRWSKDRNIVGKSNKFVDKFKKELSLIGDHIVKENDELKKAVTKIKVGANEHQIKSSTVSYYFQEIKNQVLECIYEYCISKKYITKCCSLCYDGLMIEKENYKIELLDELNVLIKDKFGFDLKFTQKKMTYYLDILDDHIIDSVDDNSTSEYQIKKLDFELTNFKVLNPLMYCKLFDNEKLAILVTKRYSAAQLTQMWLLCRHLHERTWYLLYWLILRCLLHFEPPPPLQFLIVAFCAN